MTKTERVFIFGVYEDWADGETLLPYLTDALTTPDNGGTPLVRSNFKVTVIIEEVDEDAQPIHT